MNRNAAINSTIGDRNGAPETFTQIGDYAVIGDCRSAALISKLGSIDWFCLPFFHSPSFFAAILDPDRGGRFSIAPVRPAHVERRYLKNSNVLETTFTTSAGRLRLIDQMTLFADHLERTSLHPDHEILRSIVCDAGEVEIEITFDPRAHYARRQPRIDAQGDVVFVVHCGRQTSALCSEIPLQRPKGAPGLHGRATLRAGDRRSLSLAHTADAPQVFPALGKAVERRIELTCHWWNAWCETCTYDGPYRTHVLRSALALKLLTFAPSGAVVAAPTTSLPECIGGVRNWDYRYCWLRDASMTFRALNDLGFEDEARAFLSWLMHATWLSQPKMKVMYDVWGETRLPERELEHLRGYKDSKPVRAGNAAADQVQLDVYGALADSVFEHVSRGGMLSHSAQRLMSGIGRVVSTLWREPDHGIWELRSGPRHHTLSKAMCWVALDRIIKLHEAGALQGPTHELTHEMHEIQRAVIGRGFNRTLNSYVSCFDGDAVDSSLLLLALYGFESADSPRMQSTLRRIESELSPQNTELLLRYDTDAMDDSLPGGEGAFALCAFWRVQFLAESGATDAAERGFKRLLTFANDVGLFAEEIDVTSGALLGNFPQAYTHIGLINAALSIQHKRSDERPARLSGAEQRPEVEA
jgi:GH15 family glucan-1,4-alpha-glucosidase